MTQVPRYVEFSNLYFENLYLGSGQPNHVYLNPKNKEECRRLKKVEHDLMDMTMEDLQVYI